MPTASEANATIRAVIEGAAPLDPNSGEAIPLRWRGEDNPPLPDRPAPFAFTLFGARRSGVIETGGGRGANRHRNHGVAEIFVFVPKDWGERYGTDFAEAFAAALRPYRANGVSCEDATVYPGGDGAEIAVPGLAEPGNYFWSACEVNFYFDLIG
ncbi:hypothetical protein [Rhodopseudomonas sp. RCAM05734]|uniref:hypothetical protein n=1 Tax=Rhodopseudomonas sp. RCAM05734 TaxID=3457549 RepID=UPI004044E255